VRRGLIFGALCAACLIVAVGYAGLAMLRGGPAATSGPSAPAWEGGDAEALAALRARPHLLFLDNQGDAYRRLALVPLDRPEEPRHLTTLQCQRVYVAAGRGLCLGHAYVGGVRSSFSAYTFDEDLQIGHTFQQDGLPSRVRLSPDGRYGSMTVFVSGHSYAPGSFSTQTTLVDTTTGATLGNLEDFAVWRGETRFQAVDFNFWGVTFTRDDGRFYATLGSGGKTYLIEGDVATRQARVLREDVECPSLSPDGTRLVFKKRVEGFGPIRWRLHVLDLATLADAPLAEERSVDDQVEWLDDRHVLYALPDEGPPPTAAPNLWALPVDGGGSPRLLLHQASSPAVVR
jgi:dipeptidyl aminopeptidase/acylaminoacyl peptidase